ncbi:TIGR04211 family SH3 domain-containing protein [Marinobacterium jannaschii]|uniref:TIGR04211 family SH3 domain-containing protein n=1 Tax=Marinobacterium jannaschii TaxID=64970 RepID=UPI000480CA12|nr:TIGR04211 family SH3 domain-containing protein [Marinobacterium jannaschii]
MKKLLIALLISLPLTAQAKPGHIADDVFTFYHGGPGNQYRITGRIRSGDPVEILKVDEASKYTQIRTSSGRTGWVPNDNVRPGASLAVRLPELESNLESSRSSVETQREELQNLQQELAAVRDEKELLAEETRKLQSTIKDLNFRIDSMDESNMMRWFTHGGLVALGGVILGLVLPMFRGRRKTRSEWV